ncbi:MAG: DUF58 domain-containing protein [Bryobacterales bacterium]|nr:DUF58 domain-containing protein [Bryobacterales bacterium]
MGRLFQRRDWLRAAGTLIAALLLAFASERLYVHEQAGAGLASAVAALLLCARVLALSGRRIFSGVGSNRRLRVRLPITRQGLLFLLLMAVVGGTAVYSGNNLIYLTLSSMLATLLASELVSRLTLANLNLRIALPDHIFAGQPVLARIAVQNTKRYAPSYSLRLSSTQARGKPGLELERVYIPILGAGETTVAMARAEVAQRGCYHNETIELSTTFPFGFVERRMALGLREVVTVYPSVTMHERADSILRQVEQEEAGRTIGDSHDLYRIRPAQPGDSARFLDWKAAARNGGLWVREYSREERKRVWVRFDRRVPVGKLDGALAEFERRVATCAAVLWRLSELRTEITFSSDERTFYWNEGGARVFEALAYLATVKPTQDSGAVPPPPAFGPDETAARVEIGQEEAVTPTAPPPAPTLQDA